MIERTWLLAALLVVTCLAGCSVEGGSQGVAEHDETADAGHGPGHGGGISVTHYTETTELFVEYPPLATSQEAAFAAHLTQLHPTGAGPDTAVSEGTLTVSLSGGGQPEERVTAGVSSTPGIFRPVLKPQYPGMRRLVFHLEAPDVDAVHDLGEIQVHADANAARAALPQEEDGDQGIGFTKEQQWKIDFGTRVAAERTLRESVPVTATIRPRASGEAQVSAPAAGLLRAGPAGYPRVGTQVSAGQVIGYLVPQLGAETDVATLELAVERARIDVERTQHELQRLEGLLQMEAVPEKRVHDARSQLRVAQAELESAQRRAATYRGGAGGIALKAPIGGTILAVSGSPGGAVQAGQMLAHIGDLRRIWLEARVAEGDLGRIWRPSGAFFEIEGQPPIVLEAGRNAKLVAFGGLVDPATRTVPAIFEFGNREGKLKAGMQLRASLFTGHEEHAVSVPWSAIVDDNGEAVVFVQPEGESFERRVVALGPRDGEWVAVRSGVVAGERVVARGAYRVRLAAAAPAAMGHGHAH